MRRALIPSCVICVNCSPVMRWQRWFIQLHRHGACISGLLPRSIGRGHVQEVGDYVHDHTTGKLPVWLPEKQATDDKLLKALFGLFAVMARCQAESSFEKASCATPNVSLSRHVARVPLHRTTCSNAEYLHSLGLEPRRHEDRLSIETVQCLAVQILSHDARPP